MPDDRPGVIAYVRDKCPDLSADDIGRIVEQQAIEEVINGD